MRSAITMTMTARITRKCGKFCWFFSGMGYLIVGDDYSPNMKSTRYSCVHSPSRTVS